MEAIIKLKVSEKELEIIVDSLREYTLSNSKKENVKLLEDMVGIENWASKEKKRKLRKIKGEK